jgi:hypothetical protein
MSASVVSFIVIARMRKPHAARSIERRRRAQAIVSVAPRLPLRRLTPKNSIAILAERESEKGLVVAKVSVADFTRQQL